MLTSPGEKTMPEAELGVLHFLNSEPMIPNYVFLQDWRAC